MPPSSTTIVPLLSLALAACTSTSNPALEPQPDPSVWLPAQWPSTLDDPIAAGQRTFELLAGAWRLDFSRATGPCEALDCPGAQDGADPILGATAEVVGYSARVNPPHLMWRDLSASKNVVDSATGLALGYGMGLIFYRRAVAGDLVVLIENRTFEFAREDFGRLAFADHGDRIQLVVEEPFAADHPHLEPITVRAELQTAPHAIVVDLGAPSERIGFRALREAARLDEAPLGEHYADLGAMSAPPARLVELLELAATGYGEIGAEVFVAAMALLDHASAAVRERAAHFLIVSYHWDGNQTPKLAVLDRLLARLALDPELVVRRRIATGLVEITAPNPDEPFLLHCLVAEGLAACDADSDPEVRDACTEVSNRNLARYGHCPWQ